MGLVILLSGLTLLRDGCNDGEEYLAEWERVLESPPVQPDDEEDGEREDEAGLPDLTTERETEDVLHRREGRLLEDNLAPFNNTTQSPHGQALSF